MKEQRPIAEANCESRCKQQQGPSKNIPLQPNVMIDFIQRRFNASLERIVCGGLLSALSDAVHQPENPHADAGKCHEQEIPIREPKGGPIRMPQAKIRKEE